APPIEIDAPLDPQIANRPLEPGTGGPDLNAIMKRVRDERGQGARGVESDAAKAEFIAAARRAAQAAAAEAEVMKRSQQPKAQGGRWSSLLGDSGQPVLVGVAAVRIAHAALQFGRALIGGTETVSASRQTAPAGALEMVEQPAPVVSPTDEQDVAE